MEWIKFIELGFSVVLVIVTGGLFVSTHRYRQATEEMAKATEEMAKIQQKNVEVQQKNADYLKRDNALKLFERWDAPALLEARKFTRKVDELLPDISENKLLRIIEGKETLEGEQPTEEQPVQTLRESLIHVFNFWERVRLSITYDRADEVILKATFRTVFLSMYERFEVWLTQESEKYPRFKEDLQKLYDRWKPESEQ